MVFLSLILTVVLCAAGVGMACALTANGNSPQVVGTTDYDASTNIEESQTAMFYAEGETSIYTYPNISLPNLSDEENLLFMDENGNETAINKEDLVRPSARIIVNDDGSMNDVSDKQVDSLYESLNIPESPFLSDHDILSNDAESTAVTFITAGEPNPFIDPHIPLPTYTDEEWAQLIADIESGKIPITGRFNEDGTFEYYSIPVEMAGHSFAGAESSFSFALPDGSEVSGSVVFPNQ